MDVFSESVRLWPFTELHKPHAPQSSKAWRVQGFHEIAVLRWRLPNSPTTARFFVNGQSAIKNPWPSHLPYFPLLHVNLQALFRKVFHQRVGGEGFGHHDAAFEDLAFDEEAGGEGGGEAGLDDRQ